MTKYRYILIALFFFAGLFIFSESQEANAEVFYAQTIADTNSGNHYIGCLNALSVSCLSTFNTTSTGGVSSVDFSFSKTSASANPIMRGEIWSNATTTANIFIFGTLIATSTNTVNCATANIFPATSTLSFLFSSTTAQLSNTGNNTYGLFMRKISETVPDCDIFGSVIASTPEFNNRTDLANATSGGIVSSPSDFDSYMVVTGTLTEEIIEPYIEITFPQDFISIVDFLSYNIEYSASDEVAVDITTIRSDTGDEYSFDFLDGFASGSNIAVGIAKSSPLFPSSFTYISTARLLSTSSIELASHSIQYFIIATSSVSELPTSTSTDLIITCDTTEGLFAHSFCKMFLFLFIPKTQDLQRFNDIRDLIEEKPPIGYFSRIKTALAGLSEGTSTYTIQSEVVTQALGIDVKQVFGWLLWISFSIFIIQRLWHFHL